ncbi:hypothetical protein LGIHADK_02943 [Mannheimia haemolytica]
MLLFIMFAAIILLLVLIMKFKVHAFVALIIVSLLTALAAGIPVDKILPTLLNGLVVRWHQWRYWWGLGR